MTFTTQQAEQVGLIVSGKANTALCHPVHGFSGRRIYIDGGSKANDVKGPLIHLSGFPLEECELLGAMPNPKDEYSARVTGFLRATPENLKAAADVILAATTPAYEPKSQRKAAGMSLDEFFAKAAASK